MSALDEATRLRGRARALWAIAEQIEETSAMTLHGLAGETTWRGPGPELCERMLSTNQQQLRFAAEELRRRGHLLDRTATDIELAALAAIARAG